MSSGSILEPVFDQPWMLVRETSKTSADKESQTQPSPPVDLPVLHRDRVSPIYHEPFIVDGYRKTGTSALDSIRYAFVLHNDVGNFWTHFIPVLIWVPWLIWLAKTRIDFTDPYYYPVLCFWAGSCSYALFSSMAHLFSNISFLVRSVCFILDYHGIAMYALGGGITGFFHQQSVHSLLYEYKGIMLTFEVALAVNATLFSGLSRFYWKDYRFVIRTLSFVLPYLAAVGPFTLRLLTCLTTGEECVHETIPFHLLGFLLTFLLTFFFVTKIPERFAPGRFNIFFQSHQLFHVTAAIQTSIQMYMLPLDAQLRRESLRHITGATPNFYNTFLPFLFAELFGIVIVVILGVLIAKGVLVSNKDDHTENKKD